MYSTKIFSVDAQKKVLFAEISDLTGSLSGSPFVRVFNDSIDLGIILLSHKTEQVLSFYITDTKYDSEGDVLMWILSPTNETIRKDNNTQGWSIELFND